MLLGPLPRRLVEKVMRKRRSATSGTRDAGHDGESEGRVLVIGFGRFGQIVNPVLLAAGHRRHGDRQGCRAHPDAGRFGFKVYYGDGTRLDVLRAAGAEKAEMICICIDEPEAMTEDHRDHP